MCVGGGGVYIKSSNGKVLSENLGYLIGLYYQMVRISALHSPVEMDNVLVLLKTDISTSSSYQYSGIYIQIYRAKTHCNSV